MSAGYASHGEFATRDVDATLPVMPDMAWATELSSQAATTPAVEANAAIKVAEPFGSQAPAACGESMFALLITDVVCSGSALPQATATKHTASATAAPAIAFSNCQ